MKKIFVLVLTLCSVVLAGAQTPNSAEAKFFQKKKEVKTEKGVAKNVQKGDYWLFERNVGQIENGTVVDLWCAFLAEPKKDKHSYCLEYQDGKKWLPVYPLSATKSNCYSTSSDKHPQRLWKSVRLNNAPKDGIVRFRLRQTDAAVTTLSLFRRNRFQDPQIVVYDNSTPKDTLKILFLGNSYTYYNNYPVTFKQLAFSEGHYADCHMFISGGYTMKAHLANPYSVAKMTEAVYDYAFLQDQSFNAALVGTEDDRGAIKYFGDVIAKILKKSPACKTFIEVTWGRKHGGNNLGKDNEYLKDKYPFFKDYYAMQDRMTERILFEAETLGVGTSPVGQAWRIIVEERPDIDLYYKDAHHPSVYGSYLSAAVAYLTIYKTPFSENASNGGIEPEIAKYLRSVAEKVCLGK